MIVFDDEHEYSRIVFYPPVKQAVVPPFDATFHYQLESKATNPKLLDPADIRRVEMRSDTQAVSFAELDSAVVARLKAALDLKVDSQAAPMDLLSQSETLFSEVRFHPSTLTLCKECVLTPRYSSPPLAYHSS